MRATCSIGDPTDSADLVPAYRAVRRMTRQRAGGRAEIASSNDLFNAIIDRSGSDLSMLLTDTPTGLYPYAGVPWYSTIFGRDGIITAIELLWAAPEIAKGVLKTLAALQADALDEAADAQPGKILHETRGGEWRALGEVPFRRYYGSVDATPLFVLLAGLYLKRSGDLETIRAIWPNILAALGWIDTYGDADADGFVEYQRMTERGLANQGWKDSFDSIFHADGSGAEGPIALCEVQAYVSPPSRAPRTSRALSAKRIAALASSARPRRCASASRTASGWTSSTAMHWRSTAASSRAGCCPPMPAMPCSPASPTRNGRRGWRGCSPASVSSAAGASGPSRPARRATIRCPITTARSGRTTMP
jgi:glycogen debranching enzyme